MKVASTREVIEKLQEYEREHGIGAITSISTLMDGNREQEYIFHIKDKDEISKVLRNKERVYGTDIDISSIEAKELIK